MRKDVENFLRQKIAAGLKLCTDAQRDMFRRMYGGGAESPKPMQLENALDQVERTLKKVGLEVRLPLEAVVDAMLAALKQIVVTIEDGHRSGGLIVEPNVIDANAAIAQAEAVLNNRKEA